MKNALLLALAAIAAGLGLLLLRAPPSAPTLASPLTPAAAPAAAPAAPAAPRAAPSGDAAALSLVADAALLTTPEVQAWSQRRAFDERLRRFFDTAAQQDAQAREREAEALRDGIDRYEQARQFSAGEAMNLRLGLVQATVEDEVERGARMAEIVAAYHRAGARGEAQWLQAQQHDAAFDEYKRREQIVVAEVMALSDIPGGLTRDEYLRQRLQAERVAATR